MKSYDYIEMFKEKNDLPSDYGASKKLGISRAAMSNYKNGRPLDPDLALPIAESLGIEPSEILYVINAEKTKDDMTRKAWLKLSKIGKQSGMISPSLLITLGFLGTMLKECILCKIGDEQPAV